MSDYLSGLGFGAVADNLKEERSMRDMQRKMLMDSYMEAKKRQQKYEDAANNPIRQALPVIGAVGGGIIGGIYGGPAGAMGGMAAGGGLGKFGASIGMPDTPVDTAALMQGAGAGLQAFAQKSLYDKYHNNELTTEDYNGVEHNPLMGLQQNPYENGYEDPMFSYINRPGTMGR